MKTDLIVAGYKVLATAKLSKMEGTEKINVVKAVIAMKKVATDFQAYADEAQTRLKPEGYDERVRKAQEGWDGMTEAERIEANAYVQAYNAEISDCLRGELEKEAGVEVSPLSEDALGRLFDSNPDLTVEQTVMLTEIFGGK